MLSTEEALVVETLGNHIGIGYQAFLRVLRNRGLKTIDTNINTLSAKNILKYDEDLDLIYLTPKGFSLV